MGFISRIFKHFCLLLLSLFTFLAIQEALRLKEEEARAMEKKYGKKRAREEAEKKFQQRIDDFERAEQEQELKDREMVLKNRERMEKAKELADQPIRREVRPIIGDKPVQTITLAANVKFA